MHIAEWLAIAVMSSGISLAQKEPARAFNPTAVAARKLGTAVRIDLIGDSTQTNNVGYGRGFCANLTPQVDCVNMVNGGANTRTFRGDSFWDHALATKPDYMVIQLSYSGEVNKDHLLRQVELQDYIGDLKSFVIEARAIGITPVLVTPFTHLNFGPDGKVHSDLAQYSEAMRRASREITVPLIELYNKSGAYLGASGKTSAQGLDIPPKSNDGQAIVDKTHPNWAESYILGQMVAIDLGKVVPALQTYVRKRVVRTVLAIVPTV